MDRNNAVQIVIVVVYVALRKESVDRNYKERPGQKARPVALRKESVDRNNTSQRVKQPWGGRSPQGERG